MVKTFGLTHIGLAVKDVERSLRFCQQVFGVEVHFRGAAAIQVTTAGCRDVIVFDQAAAHRGQAGGVGHFGFRLTSADDIDLALAEVERAGGKSCGAANLVPDFPSLTPKIRTVRKSRSGMSDDSHRRPFHTSH